MNITSDNPTINRIMVCIDKDLSAVSARIFKPVMICLAVVVGLTLAAACTPTTGQSQPLSNLPGANARMEPRNLLDLLEKLKRAAIDHELSNTNFYTQDHLLRFFGAHEIRWRSAPSAKSKVVDLYSFNWSAKDQSKSRVNELLVGVLTTVENDRVVDVTFRGNIGNGGDKTTYEQIVGLFGKGRSPIAGERPVPPNGHSGILPATHVHGNQAIEIDWSDASAKKLAVFSFREDGTVSYFRITMEFKG